MAATYSHTSPTNEFASSSATVIGRLVRASMPVFMGFWLAGTVLHLVRLVMGWRDAAILRSARPTVDEALAGAFASAPKPKGAEPVVSDRVSGPLAAGLRRPRGLSGELGRTSDLGANGAPFLCMNWRMCRAAIR